MRHRAKLPAMRKSYPFLLFAFFAACSSQTETATSAQTARIDAKETGGLEAWIETVQKDPEISLQLSQIALPASDTGNSAWCNDPDIQSVIGRHNGKPVIDDIRAGWRLLNSPSSHGSSFSAPHLEEIATLMQTVSAAPEKKIFEWQPQDRAMLATALKQTGFSFQSADAGKQLVNLLQSKDCGRILPRYCEYAQTTKENHAESLRNAQKLDALMVCDITAWARELRLNYPQNDYRYDRARKYLSEDAILSVRKQVFVEDIYKNGVEKAMARLEPPDAQYRLLREARKIYLDAMEAGGWPSIDAPKNPTEAKIGKSYPYVPQLKARLAAEGYRIKDEGNDIFDQTLNDAVVLYRDLHQLSPKKVIDGVLFKNLAVSPEDRLATIDLALQKYRESAIGSLYYYVKVNIPDFYMEVWRDGTRLMRHRIVVGNNKQQLDPETKKPVPDPETLYPIYPNRTPIQTSKINEVILNPYWNVPARIRIEELEPHLTENPNYYAENNYEEVNVGDPKLYYVRELPNPKNSLGKVKFMFPNPHNVYLHDTPAKAVFKLPTRALSHGCMRVQDPLDFAELLLKEDGQWNQKKFDEILNADPPEQTPVDLKHPVDVDVVYINARVDDQGPVAFLSDVYQYDAVRTGKIIPKKLPRPKDWKK